MRYFYHLFLSSLAYLECFACGCIQKLHIEFDSLQRYTQKNSVKAYYDSQGLYKYKEALRIADHGSQGLYEYKEALRIAGEYGYSCQGVVYHLKQGSYHAGNRVVYFVTSVVSKSLV